MSKKANEKQRALNIIWNASGNYSLIPELTAYDESGKADLYWNYIIGAVYKYFDYNLLSDFFNTLKYDRDYIFYQKILMLGLEGCIFDKDGKDRPALAGLRYNYGKKAAENRDGTEVFDEIAAAYFSRIMGYKIKVRDNVNSLLEELNFDSLNTEQVINKMNLIIRKYFEPEYNDEFYIKKVKGNRFLNFLGRRQSVIKGTINKGRSFILTDAEEGKAYKRTGKILSKWLKFKEKSDIREREFIKNYFGISVIGEPNTKVLEKILCNDNHESCHLHFTRGQFEDNKDSILRRELTSVQKDKNIKHYTENYIRNTNNIIKLTNRIKNIITDYSYSMKSEAGKLISEKAWRTVLDDNGIFIKSIKDEIPDISVDIMLDASASQLYRQELIAEEGYIIAESLTRCRIPVRIYSFCNMRNYTVMNLFRDYNEANSNDNVFNYCAAGFNRDGIALRTAIHMMEDSKYNHKILIILSDGKPNDMLGVSTEGLIPFQREYSDETGISDTANEVRKGWKKGISILCIFTGRDEDIPSVKKIYGQKFTRIMSLDKFAEMVGVLIEKELIN
jgi:hypothetical protein